MRVQNQSKRVSGKFIVLLSIVAKSFVFTPAVHTCDNYQLWEYLIFVLARSS